LAALRIGISGLVGLDRLEEYRRGERSDESCLSRRRFGGLFGLLVHATVDFNFHIPSNALVFLLQAALATSPLCVFTLDLESAAGVPAIDATDLAVLGRLGSTPRLYLERFERLALPTPGHAV